VEVRRAAVIVVSVAFAIAGGVYVHLATKWSRQLAEIEPYTPRTDGLGLSIVLAWAAAILLFAGASAGITVAAKMKPTGTNEGRGSR
jgi:hypothetical protein